MPSHWAFDPFDSEEGYVDLVLEDDVLNFVFDEDRLFSPRAIALYGGLPVGMTRTSVLIDVDGDGQAIARALLGRLDELGLESSECFVGGPICSFDVTYGEDHWLLSVTPAGTHALIHLQATR